MVLLFILAYVVGVILAVILTNFTLYTLRQSGSSLNIVLYLASFTSWLWVIILGMVLIAYMLSKDNSDGRAVWDKTPLKRDDERKEEDG